MVEMACMGHFSGRFSALYCFGRAAKLGGMPRVNRYILPGGVYHLTHRCHDRQFLLRFAKDLDGYRRRLREAVWSVDASLLRAYVEAIEQQIRGRQQLQLQEQSGSWVLRGVLRECYGAFSEPEKSSIRRLAG